MPNSSAKACPRSITGMRRREPWAASDIAPISNFGKGLAAGEATGLGPHGTYDMAGNAKEWCWNISREGRQAIRLGGAWDEPAYMFTDPDAQSPFSRLA